MNIQPFVESACHIYVITCKETKTKTKVLIYAMFLFLDGCLREGGKGGGGQRLCSSPPDITVTVTFHRQAAEELLI